MRVNSLPTIELGHTNAGRVGVHLVTPYDEHFVGDLKSHIPSEGRRWIPEVSAWWVDMEFIETVHFLMLRCWSELRITDPKSGEDDEIVSRDGGRAAQGRLSL